MNPRNARRIADKITDAIRAIDPSDPTLDVTHEFKMNTFRSIVYLLLTGNVDDCTCALYIYMDREPERGEALAITLRDIPELDESNCADIVLGFKEAVQGAPLITTTAELRSRCTAFFREIEFTLRNPQKKALHEKVLREIS